MINFNSNTSLSNLEKLIDLEITSLNSFLDVQKGFSTQILTFLKGFIGNVEVNSIFSDKINKYISDSSKYLTKINSNISLYNSLLEMCNSIKSHLLSDDYVKEIEEYNKQLEKSSTTILKNNAEIETFIFSTTYLDISEYISSDNTTPNIKTDTPIIKTDEEVKEDTKISVEDSASLGLTEDVLKISEIDGVVTLPYKIADLKKIMKENPGLCSTYSDVILAKYTIPLKNYKFSAISRFKEAYKLVREKEHGKRREALSLATELFANYNLHPAVITACKNLNELDVYLSCLEFDELNDFHFFKVVYEGLPVIVKKGKHGAEITAS